MLNKTEQKGAQNVQKGIVMCPILHYLCQYMLIQMLSLKYQLMNAQSILIKQSYHHQQARLTQIQDFFQQSRIQLSKYQIFQQQQRKNNHSKSKNKLKQINHKPLQIIDFPYVHLRNENIQIQPRSIKPIKSKPICHFEENQGIICRYGDYVVFRKLIGAGTYSQVYQGMQISSKLKVAVKQLQSLQPNEINCLLNINSPYIIKLYDCWTINHKVYLVLELCEGNLRQKLGYCLESEILGYVLQIIAGMTVLFRKNILHRDLKFENILLHKGVIKLADFGLAKPMGQQLQVESIRCGTPYTMAPEIYFHKGNSKPLYTSKCDIWSLGIIMHELIYGIHPFDYSIDRMFHKNRVLVNKKYGYLDVLIDKALIFSIEQRITWQQFIKIADGKGIQPPSIYSPLSGNLINNPQNINNFNKTNKITSNKNNNEKDNNLYFKPKICESIYIESPISDYPQHQVNNLELQSSESNIISITNNNQQNNQNFIQQTPIKKKIEANQNIIKRTPCFANQVIIDNNRINEQVNEINPDEIFRKIKTPKKRIENNNQDYYYGRQKQIFKNVKYHQQKKQISPISIRKIIQTQKQKQAVLIQENEIQMPQENSSLIVSFLGRSLSSEGILLVLLMIIYILIG